MFAELTARQFIGESASMKNFISRLFRRTPPQTPPSPPATDGGKEEAKPSMAQRIRDSRKKGSIGDLLLSLLDDFDDFDRDKALKDAMPRSMNDFISAQKAASGGKGGIAQDSAIVHGQAVGSRSGVGAKGNGLVHAAGVINDTVLAHFQNRGFIGWPSCAILAQHEIINRACSIPAEDAIAHGYRLVCSSMQHDQSDRHDADEARWLFDLKKYSDGIGMNDICVQLNYKKKVFGVGLALPRVVGADYEKPFNIDGVKKGSYNGFAVVDPYWLTYEFDEDDQSDPTSPSFYEPTYYRMPNGQRVHKSWIVRVVNAHVPDILKPSYYFGGIPLPQMLYERVFCADKIANEAPLMAMTKRLLIADANVEEMIKDKAHANKMMKAINYFRDNFSIFFKKPSSQVQQIDTTLGEFDQLIMTQYQLVACIAQMPATKLLKVTPTGFQSTGEYEWKDYAQALLDIQNNDYMPLLEFHYRLLLKSLYPDRDDLAVSVQFNPIDVPTKDQAATIESRNSQIISTLINAGVITPEEARMRLRMEDQGTFSFLSPIMPALLQKMMEAKDPANAPHDQQPGGGTLPPSALPPPDGGGTPPQDDGERYSAEFTEAVRQIESMASRDNEALQSGGQNGQEGESGEREEQGGDAADAFTKAVRKATGDQSIAFDEAVRIAALAVTAMRHARSASAK